MLAEAVNQLTRKNQFHLEFFRLVSFTVKNWETKKCLKYCSIYIVLVYIFLNSILTQVVLRQNICQIIWINISDTRSRIKPREHARVGFVLWNNSSFVRVSFWFRFPPKTTSPNAFVKLIFCQMQINIYWCRQYTNLFF